MLAYGGCVANRVSALHCIPPHGPTALDNHPNKLLHRKLHLHSYAYRNLHLHFHLLHLHLTLQASPPVAEAEDRSKTRRTGRT